MILRTVVTNDESRIVGYNHWCPGCKDIHYIPIIPSKPGGPKWSFNGNMTSPSFQPSVRIFITQPDGSQWTLCHYILTEGVLNYCSDSDHALKGRQVPLPEIPYPQYYDLRPEEKEADMNLNLQTPPTSAPTPPAAAPQAATPVSEGQTETVDTPVEAEAALHEDHRKPCPPI